LANVEAAYPKARPSYLFVEHPGETGQHASVALITPGRLSRGELVVVGGDARPLGEVGYESGSVGLRVLSTMTPLHFGWFGGWPVKVAYFLLGLGLTAVTSSGVAIWLARRRDKGRPAPRWERIWIAFVWSQPAAYAASALAALFLPVPPVAIWGAATLAASATAAFWTPAAISLRLRAATAGLLALTACAHMAVNGARLDDGAAWVVDAGLLLAALVLAASACKSARGPVVQADTAR
jgi:hypothetical protein